MSILNVIARPGHVEIAVDTDARMELFNAEGHEYLCSSMVSKLFPLVHLPAVIAYRGYSVVPANLFAACTAAVSYDVLADRMAQLADEVSGGIAGFSREFRELAECDQYVVLAGWSERQGRMHCSSFERTGKGAYRASEVEFLTAPSPFADDGILPRPPENREQHVQMAAAQARRLRNEPGEPAGGGDLVLCSLTRDDLSIDIVRDFAPSNARPRRSGVVAGGAAAASGGPVVS